MDTVVPERPAAEEAAGLSILRRAQERRKEQTDELDLDIPSWDGALVGHYQVVDRTTLQGDAQKILKRKGDQSQSAIESDIKFLLRATVAFSVRDPDDGKLIRLQDEHEFDIGVRELPRYLEIQDEVSNSGHADQRSR
jgi:hypothetical protein